MKMNQETMFRSIIIVMSLFVFQGQMVSWVYLWEMREDASRSCCLHYGGIDIPNPYQPCTGFVKKDLSGIFDYVSRLATTEHAKLEPFQTILSELKQYIRSVLLSPHSTIGYQVPEYTSVKFYHDIIEATFLKTKDSKNSTTAAKAKTPQNDFVAAYLCKLGLLQRRSR